MIREKFLFYSNRVNVWKSFHNEDKLKFYERVLNYSAFWIDEETDWIAETMFMLIKPQIDLNNEKYKNWFLWGEFWYKWWRPRKNVVENPNGVIEWDDNIVKEKYLDNVYLSKEEYDELVSDYWKKVVDGKIEDLDYYIDNNAKWKKYKNHKKVIIQWLKKDWIQKIQHIQDNTTTKKLPETDWFFTNIIKWLWE